MEKTGHVIRSGKLPISSKNVRNDIYFIKEEIIWRIFSYLPIHFRLKGLPEFEAATEHACSADLV